MTDESLPIIQSADVEYISKLGSGQNGSIYKAMLRSSVSDVAVKVFKGEALEDQDFIRDLQFNCTIKAQNLVKYYGIVTEKRLALVMEYCSRGSLLDVLTDVDYDIGWDKTFRFAIQTTRALEKLHKDEENPILHGDLRATHVLVNHNWEIKVCDYRMQRFSTKQNDDPIGKNRPYYCISPELFESAIFTTKCDIYSLGIIIWQIVTRCLKGKYQDPYPKLNILQIILKINSGGYPDLPSSCPVKIADLIKECLDLSPDNRPDCEKLLERLNEAYQEWQQNRNEWESLRTF
eukprot:TRINITY_DN3686_c0_g1_i1.p1 TRINITY_DN3686_c0_g1~~TRINITY_DN3686_c0_g1_i1.p1  ORF type:complete len:291 (-),score=57.18 TRINITY_DN3686_c0_g1_i1:51-923(-)